MSRITHTHKRTHTHIHTYMTWLVWVIWVMTVSTEIAPHPTPPNPETQMPWYKLKLNQNLNLNLYLEIPRNLSFSIWWILGVWQFRWKLFYIFQIMSHINSVRPDMSHVWRSQIIPVPLWGVSHIEWVMFHIWATSYESCQFCELGHVPHTSESNESCPTYTSFVPHMGHVIWMKTYQSCHLRRGGGLGSRPKKMYRERLGDWVEYHLMSPTPRR